LQTYILPTTQMFNNNLVNGCIQTLFIIFIDNLQTERILCI
jgi:hypothetical protein